MLLDLWVFISRALTTAELNFRVGWEKSFAFMGYGTRWKEHRKLFLQHFQPAAVVRYYPRFAEEAGLLLNRLVATPDDFMDHIRVYVLVKNGVRVGY